MSTDLLTDRTPTGQGPEPLSYERLDRAAVNLGRALDHAVTVMRTAVEVAATHGAPAGIRLIAEHVAEISAEADDDLAATDTPLQEAGRG